jgi:hypothetical protein
MRRIFILFSFFLASAGFCSEEIFSPALSLQKEEELFSDLQRVKQIDEKTQEKLPVLLNYMMQTGIFTMPSARMSDEGVVALGYCYLPPYQVYGVALQYFSHVELSGNYWIYNGVMEGNFGRLGFGNDAERGVNIKVSLLRKEDGIPFLPEIALGMNDFLGSKRFHSFYAVATKELLKEHLELTLGVGLGRIRGVFGGMAWSPFHRKNHLLKGLSFAIEYDANQYKYHPWEHLRGKRVRSHVNVGFHYQVPPGFHISASSIRGEKLAAQLAFNYNIGKSQGLFPKFKDPPFYTAPIDLEPLSGRRCEEEMTKEFCRAFHGQGIELMTLFVKIDSDKKKHLWMKVINITYRQEEQVRERLHRLLSSLTPKDVETVTVVVEADGLAVQEYVFRTKDLNSFAKGEIGDYEMALLSSLKEVSSFPSAYEDALLYQRKKSIWIWTLRPGFVSYFGSTTGKFKYDLNMVTGPQGYLMDQIYYDLCASFILSSSSQRLQGRDFLNPSHLLQVRSDSIRYNQRQSLHLQTAYLQRQWNCSKGFFARAGVGYFEIAYAGAALEALYYPVSSPWAFGFELASLLKRKYSGLGFQWKVRKLSKNNVLHFVPYVGLQYFLEFYYDIRPLQTYIRISLGQFLAKDKGIKLEWTRYFSSGFNFSLWCTVTDGNDRVNAKRYFDKGFAFSMPLDWFMNKSSRSKMGYGMSAWLRDVGARAKTGRPLFVVLHEERENLH